MKANTNRSHATAFDAYADTYDAGRRAQSAAILRPAFEEAALVPGQTVMEVGAGTGQMTGALLALGLRVVAVEPGDRMRGILAERYPELTLRAGRFEEQPAADGPYDAIVSANAWHWVDPERGYPLAADVLREDGCLLLTWSFARAEADIQQRLNAHVFTGPHSDHQRDPQTFEQHIDEVTAAGRTEIEASGRFAVTWWRAVDERFTMTPEEYVDHLRSFANTASLDASAQASFAASVRATVGTAPVPVWERRYQVVARRLPVFSERMSHSGG